MALTARLNFKLSRASAVATLKAKRQNRHTDVASAITFIGLRLPD